MLQTRDPGPTAPPEMAAAVAHGSASQIREATPADIPALLDMGARFADAVKSPVGYDRATAEHLFRHLIDSPLGVLLVTDQGAAGAILFPHPFDNRHMAAQELFWWVNPEHRGPGLRLFTALETAVQAKGADSLTVSAMEALNHDAAAQLYARRGYEPVDRNFLKVF